MAEGPGSFRERAERLFAARQGDSLGLRDDPEARILLTEIVAERYTESFDPALLRDWEAMVAELEQSDASDWPPELQWRLQAQRNSLSLLKKVLARRRHVSAVRVHGSRRKRYQRSIGFALRSNSSGSEPTRPENVVTSKKGT